MKIFLQPDDMAKLKAAEAAAPDSLERCFCIIGWAHAPMECIGYSDPYVLELYAEPPPPIVPPKRSLWQHLVDAYKNWSNE